MTPEAAMELALREARRASGRTFPNPAVGAVVFRGRRLLGRGFTRPPGGPHAEVVALDAAARRFGARALRGASLAVTLEPCCFTGRTGPCTRAILDAGIARAYVGVGDPHPRVSGRGLRALRGGGVRVTTGVRAEACAEQHRGFVSVHERGRPFVELKLASSLDGRIATAAGESRWITGARARAEVHRMRARVDAVLVGRGTALADDPSLTARRGGRVVHRPLRVVADTRLRVPARARAYRLPGRAVALCARDAPAVRRARLEAAGVEVLPVRRRGARLDAAAALRALGALGVTTLLVEGGGELAAALLRSDLVDELHWFAAPCLLGADGRPALAALGVRRLAQAPFVAAPHVRRLGADLYLRGAPRRMRGAR